MALAAWLFPGAYVVITNEVYNELVDGVLAAPLHFLFHTTTGKC